MVVEIRGCFWHRHSGCKKASTPSSNVEFWQEKFKRNVERDLKNEELLRGLGWRVIVVWECELKDSNRLSQLVGEISDGKKSPKEMDT